MERLTKTSEKGGLAFTFDLDVTCSPSDMRKIYDIGVKLKAYEDTGLTPERCAELSLELDSTKQQLKAANECIARCQEALDDLAEADSD